MIRTVLFSLKMWFFFIKKALLVRNIVIQFILIYSYVLRNYIYMYVHINFYILDVIFFNLWIKPHEKMLVGSLFCHLIWKAETIWCNDQNGVWFPPGRWAVGRVLRELTWPDIVVSFDRRPFIKQQSLVWDLDLSALIEPLMFFGTVNFIIVWNPIVFLFSFFSSWILNVTKDVLHIIECNHR